MEEIDNLISDLQFIKWPGTVWKGKDPEAHKSIKKYWLNFVYGFDELSWLTLEQLEDFKSFMKKIIEGERKKRALPGL